MKHTALTFDLDLTDYVGGKTLQDEFEKCWPVFQHCCEQIPHLKSTWFIRIDDQIELQFGAADYIFNHHAEKINWLRENGHEVAWHFHSYRNIDNKWQQNPDDRDVANELTRNYPIAAAHNLKMLRMGWAYHTAHTINTIANLGITMDCTAFPRPVYQWDNKLRNWSQTGQLPYYPSKDNFNIPGSNAYGLIEVPISTVPLPLPSDTEPDVLRYINPAYENEYFKTAIRNLNGEYCNLISHPYEFLKNTNKHSILSFDPECFLFNLKWLVAEGFQFHLLSELALQQISKP